VHIIGNVNQHVMRVVELGQFERSNVPGLPSKPG